MKADSKHPYVLILAAGKGTRMKSELPKVLHPLLFRPLIQHVVELAGSLTTAGVGIVVGHGEAEVKKTLADYSDLIFFSQEEQRGTGHAVSTASKFLSDPKGKIIILSGDVVLLKPSSLHSLVQTHEQTRASGTLVTAHLTKPQGYGRILRDQKNNVLGIREERDATPEEKALTEVNAGIYIFDTAPLSEALGKIENKNQQGEFYLTDVVALLAEAGHKIATLVLSDAREMMGINDRRELAEVENVMRERINEGHMLEGVSMSGPQTIRIDPGTKIGADTTIEPNCTLIRSEIGEGVVIESGCRVIDSTIGDRVHLKQGSYIEKSEIGAESQVGPYARLRPGSLLSSRVKVGNFVEIKNSRFAENSKAAHLSYVGDAEIGKEVNLGCGFITCNYDGNAKHRTVIEDGVFVGSDSQIVAPVRIGAGSYVASGTTVTQDVPPDSLVLSRGKQVTKADYAKKYKKP